MINITNIITDRVPSRLVFNAIAESIEYRNCLERGSHLNCLMPEFAKKATEVRLNQSLTSTVTLINSFVQTLNVHGIKHLYVRNTEVGLFIFKDFRRFLCFQARLTSDYEIKLVNYTKLRLLHLKNVWLEKLTPEFFKPSQLENLYLSFRQNDTIKNGSLTYLAQRNNAQKIYVTLHMQPKTDNELGDRCYNQFDETLFNETWCNMTDTLLQSKRICKICKYFSTKIDGFRNLLRNLSL